MPDAEQFIMSFIQKLLALEGVTAIIIQLTFVVLLTIIIRVAQARVFKRLNTLINRNRRIWDKALVYSLEKPVGSFVWFMGFIFSAKIIANNLGNPTFFAWIEPAREITTAILFGWFLFRFVAKAEHNFTQMSKSGKTPSIINQTTASTFGKILRVAICILMVLVILQILEIPISGFLTLGSVGTAVFAFAGKDVLANFFGGFMVFLDRPFAIGDWVRSPDRSIEGTIEHIGWRTTTIRTFSKRPLYVPNSAFVNISVENPSRMSNRQIKEVFGLRYQDASKLPLVVAEVEDMIKNHPDIDTQQTIFVAFNHFGPSSLDCQIYCFTKTTAWVPYLKVQQDVFTKIIAIVKKHGADIAFPTTTFDIPPEILHSVQNKS